MLCGHLDLLSSENNDLFHTMGILALLTTCFGYFQFTHNAEYYYNFIFVYFRLTSFEKNIIMKHFNYGLFIYTLKTIEKASKLAGSIFWGWGAVHW